MREYDGWSFITVLLPTKGHATARKGPAADARSGFVFMVLLPKRGSPVLEFISKGEELAKWGLLCDPFSPHF